MAGSVAPLWQCRTEWEKGTREVPEKQDLYGEYGTAGKWRSIAAKSANSEPRTKDMTELDVIVLTSCATPRTPRVVGCVLRLGLSAHNTVGREGLCG